MRQNERLKTFKKVVLGQYMLKDFENKKDKGCLYLKDISKWEDIKNKNIYFNIFDQNHGNPFKKLREIIVENFLKTNFIIIRLEAANSSLSFYCNNLPNILDPQFLIIKLLVNPYDFIDFEGEPIYNETYTLSYILNDPNKELNVTKTITTNVPSSTSHVFSLNTQMTLPKGNLEPIQKYSEYPNIPAGTAIFTPRQDENEKSIAEDEINSSNIKIDIPIIHQEEIGLIVFILFLILLFVSKYI